MSLDFSTPLWWTALYLHHSRTCGYTHRSLKSETLRLHAHATLTATTELSCKGVLMICRYHLCLTVWPLIQTANSMMKFLTFTNHRGKNGSRCSFQLLFSCMRGAEHLSICLTPIRSSCLRNCPLTYPSPRFLLFC